MKKIRGPKRILIVDDEVEVCNLIAEFLSKRKYLVEKAHTAIDAFGSLKKGKPDLIILDVIMPGMDGFTFLGNLKKDSAYAAIPVIMLTIKSQSPDLEKGISLRADFYLPKPFKLDNLLQFVRLLLEGEI